MAQSDLRGLAALAARLRDASRRQKLASLGIALLLEALIALLLLTLGAKIAGDPESKEAVTTFKSVEFAAPPAPEPEPEQAQETTAADTPQETGPVSPAPPLRPSPLSLNPQPAPPPAPPAPPEPAPDPQPSPAPARPKIGARVNPNRSYGPVDTGNPRTVGDSERVGTAPNGEPLYAARWYREPTDQELAGYLSTAQAPSVALIACKTVSGYYVEDCVLLSESPSGSQIGRAVLAAAWQFRVRPARIGGQEQFGSWVRIQITYSVRQRPR